MWTDLVEKTAQLFFALMIVQTKHMGTVILQLEFATVRKDLLEKTVQVFFALKIVQMKLMEAVT